MSATATDRRLSLGSAYDLARRVVDALRPGCERIEIAGSIRRRKATIGDIELVLVPELGTNLFGEVEPGESLLDAELARLLTEGRIKPGRCNGDKHKNYLLAASEVSLDLFIVEPATWAVIFAIRTGSASFAKSIVTQRKDGGRLDDGLIVRDGRVWDRSHVITGMIDGRDNRGPFFHSNAPALDTPEEADFFAVAGGWVKPEDRL